MAQTGYTPIQLYYSTTASATPSAGNLANGELALNITDGKLYYKDNGGTVQLLAQTGTTTNVASISFGSTGLTPATATTGAVTVAGTLATGNGGTGLTTFTAANNAIYSTSSSALTAGTLPILAGGTGATTASGARTNFGATTVGSNFFTLTNPSAITFVRINADNTVSTLNAADFRTAIGAGSGAGTVTSITAGTGLTGGTITTSGTIAIDSTVVTLTGTQTLTNKTLTSPRIGTAILDTNGNEVFSITATASAVNDFTIVNAATGNNPQIQATGGDTNIGINLVPKGSGTVQAGGVPVVTTTGTQTLTNKTLTSPTISGPTINDGYTEEVFTVTDTAGVALSPTNGSIQTWTLGASRTPTSGTWASGQSMTLMIDDGSAFTVTWTTLNVIWETDNGSAPTLATSGFTTIVLWKVSTQIYGARVGNA